MFVGQTREASSILKPKLNTFPYLEGGQAPSRVAEIGLLLDGLVITSMDKATYFLGLRKLSSI